MYDRLLHGYGVTMFGGGREAEDREKITITHSQFLNAVLFGEMGELASLKISSSKERGFLCPDKY